jgi:DNA gyrase inhibitor GyrI
LAKLTVRIVTLAPMQLAGANGFGREPEVLAWEKLLTWAKGNRLVKENTRYFGFNNPSPSATSPDYGYDQWMTVGPEVKGQGDIRIWEFPGGTFAVTRCKLDTIQQTWQELLSWALSNKYRIAPPHMLEECIEAPGGPWDQMVFDLYLPIEEV